MKVLRLDVVSSDAQEEENKIPFSIVTFKCGVRFPLAPFIKKFLSELPFYPFRYS